MSTEYGKRKCWNLEGSEFQIVATVIEEACRARLVRVLGTFSSRALTPLFMVTTFMALQTSML